MRKNRLLVGTVMAIALIGAFGLTHDPATSTRTTAPPNTELVLSDQANNRSMVDYELGAFSAPGMTSMVIIEQDIGANAITTADAKASTPTATAMTERSGQSCPQLAATVAFKDITDTVAAPDSVTVTREGDCFGTELATSVSLNQIIVLVGQAPKGGFCSGAKLATV
jgi:hypothetical protein